MAPSSFNNYKWFSAFTVAELRELLPPAMPTSKSKDGTGWYMNVINPLEKWNELFPCETEADARAKMLIHLIEKSLVKEEDLK